MSSRRTATIDWRPSSLSPKVISGDDALPATSWRMAAMERRPSSASPTWISGSDSGRGSVRVGTGALGGGGMLVGLARRLPTQGEPLAGPTSPPRRTDGKPRRSSGSISFSPAASSGATRRLSAQVAITTQTIACSAATPTYTSTGAAPP